MMVDSSNNEADANDLLSSMRTLERHQRNEQIVKIFEEYFAELHTILLSQSDDHTLINLARAERERFIQFIALTSFLLRHFDSDEALISKLMLYVSALKDLETGRVHPILQPTFVASVPPESTERWRIRATLAVALEYLIRAQTPFDEAVRKVAGARRINQILKSRAAAKSSLKSWRNDLRTGKVTNQVALKAWSEGLSQYETIVARSANEKERLQRLKEGAKLLVSRAETEIALLVNTK
jgi:hypothetical protein